MKNNNMNLTFKKSILPLFVSFLEIYSYRYVQKQKEKIVFFNKVKLNSLICRKPLQNLINNRNKNQRTESLNFVKNKFIINLQNL